MRHRVAHRKLGRTTPHRIALLRNLAASLIAKERIRTTVAKAKELRPFVEKLVTLGKRDSLHARRRALSILPQKGAVKKLFSDISPRFSERPGGYTRILKLAPRQGDGADMAFIEFVDFKLEGVATGPAPESPKAKKQAVDEEAEEPEAEAKPKKKATRKAKTKAKAKADDTAKEPEDKPARKAKKKTTKKKATKKKP